MSVNRNKALFEMFRQGKVPIEPFVCIDAYNKKLRMTCFVLYGQLLIVVACTL